MPATISPAETYRRLSENGRAELIDVRTPGEFARQHAAGARCIPLDQLDPAALGQESGANEQKAIYLICQSGKRASIAAEKLAAANIPNAIVVEGGTNAWAAAGLPCESTGTGVISLERQVRIVAGSLVLASALLAWFVHALFVWLAAFIGAGLIFAGVTDFCGMALLLARMPWNRAN